ncbi:hypothetical protein CBER1_07319 [Cercospora berteroae]|uniref:Uncharacterized protein n=1 Tax=Cercospora berteroae TaxID=357750 RepID=A0A2S6CEV3_9PEZI|nr:hypothetical protein CBER1_07319 [Cercospora berteroae]
MLTIAACGAAAHAVEKHHKERKAAQQVQAHNAIVNEANSVIAQHQAHHEAEQQALVDKANGIIAQQQAALQAAEEKHRLQQQQQQQQAYSPYPQHQQPYAASAYGQQPPPPTAQHLPPPAQPYQYSPAPGTPYSAPATPYSAGPPTPYSDAMTRYQQHPAASYHHIGWCSRQCGNTCNGNADSTYSQQTQSASYQSYGAPQPPPYSGYQQGYRSEIC